MAGEVSKDLSKRVLLPEEIVRAHEEGIIHFHDTDYFAQKEHNCDLINLEDMLQNGTVISETMIEKPHSFFTACNVTTQIVAQVASNQYGGQSFTLAHLAPFVDISRQKLRKNVIAERTECGEALDEDIINRVTERRLREEVKSGIQTIQYQLITLMTCNGQAPFVTVFMYLDEVPEGRTRDDLAMIIEEVMLQRMQGVKNEKGVWITPAFPKLIYVLDEDNITRQTVNTQLKEHHVELSHILEVTTMDLLIQFAEIGLGIACVIRDFVKKELEEGTLVEVPVGFSFPLREIGFVCRQKDADSALIAPFFDDETEHPDK